jgi:ribonuclease-3
MIKNDFNKFEKKIGYKFKDKTLLINALSHTSYAHDNKTNSNEKLEFLGDSILEYIISKHLYEKYRKLKEGEMTKIRASVVSEKSLYKVAKNNNFSEYILLGKSEKASSRK